MQVVCKVTCLPLSPPHPEYVHMSVCGGAFWAVNTDAHSYCRNEEIVLLSGSE